MTCCGPLPSTPKGILGLVLRVSFGLSLFLVGIAHFMTLEGFSGFVVSGLGPLTPLGQIWVYVLPLLMIVGGGLTAVGMYREIATWAVGVALGSIPVGMIAKAVLSGMDLGQLMPPAINAFIWLLLFVFVVKCNSCCGDTKSSGSCCK